MTKVKSKTEKKLITISIAGNIINANNLIHLAWKFKDCPLKELKHYISTGHEEVAILTRAKEFLTDQVIAATQLVHVADPTKTVVSLKFHSKFVLHIIMQIELPG